MANISKVELNGTTYNIKTSGSIPTSEKGAANGVASLDSTGKVPSSQLPSYVDDVLEYSAKSSFPTTGETGKIYVDTSTNKTYRWSGSAYVEISESLALGETSSTAYRGDRGKTAYEHSQTTSGNPHNVTKSDVGLGNVGNFKAVSTAASQGLSNTEKSNARANIGAGTGNGTYSKPSGGIPKSDLATAVQTSLGKADSALQSETDPTVPSWAKQTNKPSYTQDEVTDGTTYKRVTSTEKSTWNSKQNALTTTQMNAVNSGINSTKVDQISTNQTNILYGLDKVGTNLIKHRDDLPTVITALPEGIRIQRANTTSSFAYVKCGTVYLESGKKYVLYDATYSPSTKHHYFYVDCGGSGFIELSTPSLTATVQYGTGRTTGTYDIYTRIDANSTVDTISTPIICLESVWKQLDAYTPYALPNYDLTRLEAEDRAGLVECVDGGAKNLLSIEGETRGVNGVTATYNSDGSITTSGTASGGNANFTIHTYTPAEATKLSGLVLSGCPSGGSTNTWRLILQKNSANYDVYAEDTGNGAVVGTVPSVSCVLILQIKSGYSKNATWYPMLCTKATFGVSNKFVPYCKSNSDLTGIIAKDTVTKQSWIKATDLNNVKTSGYYKFTGGPANSPSHTSGDYGMLMVMAFDNYITQLCHKYAFYPGLYTRSSADSGATWSDWSDMPTTMHYKADTTTTIGTDWTLTSIVLQAPVDALVPMTVMALWGAKAPRGIRITRTNTSATNNVIATIEVSEDKGQIQASGFGAKLNGVNTYYVWAKAKESGTMPVYLTYSYPIKD